MPQKWLEKILFFFFLFFLGGGQKSLFWHFWFPPKNSHLERSEKKSEEKNKKWKTGHFRAIYTFRVFFLAILAILGYFLKKKLCSRGLHYYGMILLCIWVRFKHFPPLVDFSSLKTPSRHMWPKKYFVGLASSPTLYPYYDYRPPNSS